MPTATFFGATGGCALAALIKTLEAGISTTALVRTPSKLEKLLADAGVSASTVSAHLRIVEGNVKDKEAVKQALQVQGQSQEAPRISDIIISGVGGTPKLSSPFSFMKPVTIDDPGICFNATNTIVTALRELQQQGASGRPLFAVVSTTGISSHGRDVPVAFLPIYHWLLALPHEDKRNMETLLEETAAQGGDAASIKGFVAVRPSLLLDGEGVGVDKLRVGWEGGEDQQHGPAVGYTITRNDVGAWLFEEIVKNDERDKWLGKMVTLTT